MDAQDGAAAAPAANTAPPDSCPTAQLDQIVSTAFSTDGAHALIHFKDPSGRSMILTMAVEKLSTLQHLASQMRQRLKRKDLPVDQVVMQFPQQFMVGHSDQARNVVAITFDQQLPTEAVYVLTDEAGLNLADGLQQNIFSRMTPTERHAYERKRHPLLLPIGQGKLIRP